MQRIGMYEIDDFYFVDAQVQQFLHIVRMDLFTGAIEFFFGVAFLDDDGLGENAAHHLFLVLPRIRELHLFCFVEGVDDFLTTVESEGPQRRPAERGKVGVDDFFATVETQGPQEHGRQDPFLAVDLGVDEFALLVDFKFQPRTPVGNNP